MTTSPDLIDRLVDDLTPAPRAWIPRRLATGLVFGALISAGLTLGLWGLRPDIAKALTAWPFWTKLGFTGLLTMAGALASIRLAQPGLTAPRAIQITAATLAAMSLVAVVQYMVAPDASRRVLVFGATAATCPWLIMALALPILAGGIWAFQALAPTRLASAGAAIGLASGAGAAAIYALSCDEVGMPFVVLWYGLGIAVPTVIGGLVGPRLLRW